MSNYDRARYAANREQYIAYATKYYEANIERIQKYRAEWRQKNREYIAKKRKAYYAENRERKLAYHAEYRAKNNRIVRARNNHAESLRRVQRVREYDATLPPQPELTPEQRGACVAARLKSYELTELMSEAYEVDHIVEIEAGGLEAPENLQVITRRAHRAKTSAHRRAMAAVYRRFIRDKI